MSLDLTAPSVRQAQLPRASRFAPLESQERRGRPRRAADRKQSTLAALADWFANRQARPLIVVDAQMNLIVVNDAARRLVQGTPGFAISGRKLVFRGDRRQAKLARALSEETKSAPVTLRLGGSAVSAEVSRIALPSDTGTLFLITMQPADEESRYDRLQAQFGLSRAEAEIALAIFNGSSLVAIARGRGASVNTVKTQARYIFQKCRVRSQVALTRRLGELA